MQIYIWNCTDPAQGEETKRKLKLTAASYNCIGRKNTYLEAKRQNLHFHVFFFNHKTLKFTTEKPKQILMKRESRAIETLLINTELINNGPPIYYTATKNHIEEYIMA